MPTLYAKHIQEVVARLTFDADPASHCRIQNAGYGLPMLSRETESEIAQHVIECGKGNLMAFNFSNESQ